MMQPPQQWSHMTSIGAAAYALGFAYLAVCHGWLITKLHLNRLEWCLALLGGTGLLFWPLKVLLRRIATIWSRENRWSQLQAVVVSGCCGLVMNAGAEYRLSQHPDNLWIHPESLQLPMRYLLGFAQVGGFALMVATFLSSIVWSLSPAAPGQQTQTRKGLRIGSFAAALAAGLVIINFTAWNFVHAERTAHYWDFMGYWLICADYADVLAQSPSTAFDQFVQSVRSSEYTLLPALVPSLGMTVVGDSRMAYVLLVSNIYGALILSAAIWGNRVVAASASVSTACLGDLWVAVAVACLPLIWAPTLRGYLDLGGVGICLCILGVSVARPVRALTWQQIVMIGLALATLALFRRWYSFWVVSFLFVTGVETLLRSLSQARYRASFRQQLREWTPLVAIAGIALFVIVSFSWLSVLRIAGTSYGNAYGAYKSVQSSWAQTSTLLSEIGYGYVVLFIFASLQLLWDSRTRRIGLVAIAMVILMHFHFHRIQDMGWHHRMLYAPSFILVVGLAGIRWLNHFAGAGRILLFAGLVVPYVMACQMTFMPTLNDLRLNVSPLTPRSPTYPEVRADVEELARLATDLDRVSETHATGFAVVASSAEFNQTHVLTVHRSLGLPTARPTRQRMLPEADKVNGFPQTFFECGVIAVAEPLQTHLRPEEQQILRLLGHDLTSITGLGLAFQSLPDEYRLVNGIAVTIWVRTRPFTAEEVAQFRARLRACHPDLEAVFEPRHPVPLWPTGMR